MQIGVECTFAESGAVQVKRVLVNGRWQAVEQGRQWQDDNGRHVLIMLAGGEVHEIVLQAHTLTWEMQGSLDRPVIV